MKARLRKRNSPEPVALKRVEARRREMRKPTEAPDSTMKRCLRAMSRLCAAYLSCFSEEAGLGMSLPLYLPLAPSPPQPRVRIARHTDRKSGKTALIDRLLTLMAGLQG